MNIVIDSLRKNISSQDISFVFPSQTAASLWARKTCTLGICRSVAASRFIAWDRFKEQIIEEKEKQPATAVMRKLFAESLVQKNTKHFFLRSVIPLDYAENSSIFAPYIARILPSLAAWEKIAGKTTKAESAAVGSVIAADDPANSVFDFENRDFSLIKDEYQAFLDRHELFEPAWEKNKILEGNINYIIFFPELIEDFIEYEALLTAPRFIIINNKAPGQEDAFQNQSPQNLSLTLYESAREEIRSAVLEMQRLYTQENIPYEDMAVSVPELEEMEPCLLKELRLRHIPFRRRAGRPLGETGVGRFFSLINECAASGFSFNSLKALILNDHIPWREREKNQALIEFGIEYNCVSGYTQNNRHIDIWEEAFKAERQGKYKALYSYYAELKKRLLAITASKNFKEIRKHYFAFRGDYNNSGFLDMDYISKEDDAILSRCIEELSSLIELEEMFDDPGLVPSSPFGFFISCLKEKEYVLAEQKNGINIFKWRVAAASPFSCHFVLNASQSAASVLYQPMKFLREDKRKALGLADRDASAAFFTLCDTGFGVGTPGASIDDFSTRLYISASTKTFSGWAIPHSFFAGSTIKAATAPTEPYQEERGFWRTLPAAAFAASHSNVRHSSARHSCAGLEKIYPMQKLSFDNWNKTLELKQNNFSFLNSPLPQKSPAPVMELLKNALPKEDNTLTVTPTNDLNVFYFCPVMWLYKRIFKAEEFSLEAALLDDTALGLLYHRILEALFEKIKAENNVFNSQHLDIYKEWAFEITQEEIKKQRVFKGPLATPLVLPMAFGISKKINALLLNEAKYFDNYHIVDLELKVNYLKEGLLVKGVIDRVSLSPAGEPLIIDYKTRYLPDQISLEELNDSYLSEFQMPLYIKLYEEKIKEEEVPQVTGACFFSIAGRNVKVVVGEKTRSTSKALSREEYAPILEAAGEQINEFGQKVESYNFVPPEIHFSDCVGCMYKTVCRTTYS